MRVAKYWASTEVVRENPAWGCLFRHAVWAGSDVSEADAAAKAEDRAAELRGKPIIEPPRGRRRARPTEGDDGYHLYPRWTRPEPMLDEVLSESGERVGAITLNGYGAEVLNTAYLAFIDIDGPARGSGLFGWLQKVFGSHKRCDPLTDDPRTMMVRVWAGGNARCARIYQTAGGLRVLIVRPEMDPSSDEVAHLMRSFGADTRYATLCRVQQSFRARLTPKPWRVGLDRFAARYEQHRDGDPGLLDWTERYHAACEGYAVCRLIEEVGQADAFDPAANRLIELHDAATGVGQALPLA